MCGERSNKCQPQSCYQLQHKEELETRVSLAQMQGSGDDGGGRRVQVFLERQGNRSTSVGFKLDFLFCLGLRKIAINWGSLSFLVFLSLPYTCIWLGHSNLIFVCCRCICPLGCLFGELGCTERFYHPENLSKICIFHGTLLKEHQLSLIAHEIRPATLLGYSHSGLCQFSCLLQPPSPITSENLGLCPAGLLSFPQASSV